MSKPLQVTTPTHAIAMAAYAVFIILSCEYLLDVAQTTALASMVGDQWSDLWSALYLMVSVVALASAYSASREADPSRSLAWEGFAAGGIGVCNGIYLWSLIHGYGIASSATTQTYALMFTLGGAARGLQCWHDVRAITAARRHPELATPSPLAEPPHQGR